MAILIPDIQKIEKLTVKATDGELHLLKTLSKKLDDSYEVYFNPYLNGDRPDVVVFHPTRGVLFIEVKDWDLDLYCLDEKKHWKLKMPKDSKEANAVLKSPISQALKYKDNLYELHIEKLLELKIKDVRHFNFVSCAVYFHNGTSKQIGDLLVSPYVGDCRYMNFLKYNIDFFSKDLLEQNIEQCLKNRWLDRDSYNNLFTKEISDNIKRFLAPTCHTKEEGESFSYDRRQQELIYSPRTEMRVKGVVGSGKTTVMAYRAALAASKPAAKVLIISYNITLKNYIHDKLQRVSLDFDWGNITINNYHEFINSQLNNLGVAVSIPEGYDSAHISEYLENNYYGNKSLFEDYKDKTERYDAIFIDEIQDYHRAWMEIIKGYFWNPNGQYILFGDVKQNIYSNSTENKDVHANVRSILELKQCHRSQFKVRELAVEFQKQVFKDKYDIDDFNKPEQNMFGLDFNETLEGYVNYMYLDNVNSVVSLFNIIRGNMINKLNGINPNDITVLGYRLSTLQHFEAYYRYKTNEHTTTMFETYEIMFLKHLNYFTETKHPTWYQELLSVFAINNKIPYEDRIIRGRVAYLLTIYHLWQSFKEDFHCEFNIHCAKFKMTTEQFLQFCKRHENELQMFYNEVFQDDYSLIQKNKKVHFWMNSGSIKVSTIHSFKGWESEVVFLILEQKNDLSTSFDELLYTGITRSRANLVIVNYGNNEYHNAIQPLIMKLNN